MSGKLDIMNFKKKNENLYLQKNKEIK